MNIITDSGCLNLSRVQATVSKLRNDVQIYEKRIAMDTERIDNVERLSVVKRRPIIREGKLAIFFLQHFCRVMFRQCH